MASSSHPLQHGSFDPLALLRRARASGNVPEQRSIMLRMMWLRQRIPECRVDSSLVSLDDRTVVMAASISLPDGSKASGHAAANLDDSADVASRIELTETRAIGRALDVLGYVVMESSPSSERPASPPPAEFQLPDAQPRPERQGQPPEHVQALRQMKDRPRAQPETQERQSQPDVPDRATPAPRSEQPEPAPSSSPSPAPAAPPRDTAASDMDDPPLEDVSWTAFWNWARATYKLGSRVQLETLLGQSVGRKTPGELRMLLQRHFAEDDSPES